MQCKCGGEATIQKVIRDKNTAGEFMRCTACGRISWLWRSAKLKEELDADNE